MPVLKKTISEYLFVTLTIAVGVLASFFLAEMQQQTARHKSAEQFRVAAHDRINVISNAVNDNISLSHSVVSFFQASQEISREEFSVFTSEILKEAAFIEALEWAPVVAHAERQQYESTAAKAVPGYSFKDIQPDASLTVAKERSVYYPILFIEPVTELTNNLFGVDFTTNLVRRKAIESSMASNKVAVTERVNLLSSHKPGVLFFSPVIKNENVQGFVVAAIALDALVSKAIEPLNKEGVNIIAHDISNGEPKILFIHSSRLKKATDEEVMKIYNSASMKQTADIDVAGRKWRLTVVPSDGFFKAGAKNYLIILISGLCFTAMLAYFMVNRIRENVRISEIVELRTSELEKLASFDPLTNLANRRLFLELLEKGIARAERSGIRVAVIYIDLNDFKPVNDKLGHAAGDELLRQFGERISKKLRVHDTTARIGGDEFAILADNLNDIEGCEVVVKRVLATLAEPYDIYGNKLYVSASIGAAVYPFHAQTLDGLMAAADSAMYLAKRDKTRPYVIFAE